MDTTEIGRNAESLVCDYLRKHKYKIVDRNWRTRMCEIDVIALKSGTIYFIEVKYRSSDSYGGGLEYITPKKLKQIYFAANSWISQHNWSGDAVLLGAEVTIDGVITLVELA